MTISTSRATEMTVDQIVKMGWQLSGAMGINEAATGQGWNDKAFFARTILDSMLDELQIYGVFAKNVVFENTTLTADTANYTLSSYVLDVIGNGMYIAASESDVNQASGETMITQITREEWNNLSSKDASGTPTMFYYHRPLQQVRLWPIPDEAGTVRFQIHKFMSDSYEGGATLEVRQYWYQYLIWELAHQIAISQSLKIELIGYLGKHAKQKLMRARGFAMQHQNKRSV